MPHTLLSHSRSLQHHHYYTMHTGRKLSHTEKTLLGSLSRSIHTLTPARITRSQLSINHASTLDRMRVGALTTGPFSTARQASYPTAGKETDRSPSHHIYYQYGHARYPALVQQGVHRRMIQAALNKRASRSPIPSGQARTPPSSSLRSSTKDRCRHGLLRDIDGFGQAQLKAY